MTDKVQKIRSYLADMANADGVCTVVKKAIEKKILPYIDSMQKESVSSIWHDASEEPKDMSHCLICYKAGDKVTYMDIIPVLYNKNTKEFVSHSYPHATDNKIEYGSIEGHGVVNVFKNMRDRYPITDIDKWAYIVDVLNVAVRSKETASEELEEAIGEYCSNPDNFATWIGGKETDDIPLIVKAIKFGANWQKEQMMKDSVLCGVDGWFINNDRHCRKNGRFYKYYVSTISHDKPLPMESGKDYRLITVKED